ncbi:MAG: hypothetical protein PHQ42_05315 [Patescibacteria group bacterium]|jgi:cbb3-type cytochrome oxidase subunit 3|nr:hypothetical protein [Patescibacteria group bacterium]
MDGNSAERLIGSSRFYWIIAALFLAAIFVLSLNQIADFDTGYHLKTGEYIVQHLAVPHYDIFSYATSASRWIAHYWLSDVIFYLINLISGFKGLIVFAGLMAVLTYFIVLKTAWDKIGKSIIPLFVLFILAYFSAELWVVRPQVFSYLLTALLIFALERWRKSNNKKLLYFLPLIFILWANLHAGVILGIAILGAYAVGLVIKRIKSRIPIVLPLIIFFLSCAATLLNPNGYKVLTYNFDIASTVKDMGVMEWQSLLSYTSTWQSKVFIALMLVFLIIVLWHAFRKKKFFEIDWTSVALILGFFAMPLISIRHVGFFPIVAVPLVSGAFFDFISKKKIEIDPKPIIWIFSGALMALVIISGAIRIWNRSIVNESLLPVKAVDFIEKNNISGPMFNFQSSGGYLIWRLWPKQLIFMDGRSEVFAGKPNENLKKVLFTQPGWQDVINQEYKVNYFIMWYREPTNKIVGDWMLKTMFEMGFKLVYWDDVAVILVRNSAENEAVIDKYAYHVINPFIHPSQIVDKYLPNAVDEIERALSISSNSIMLQNYADELMAWLTQSRAK